MVATLDELEAGVPVRFPDEADGFVVKLRVPAHEGIGPDSSIVAFSSVCPHMGCEINATTSVDVETGRFGPCTCHQSLFDLTRDGRMIHGCASSNLSRIEISLIGEEIWAALPVRPTYGQPLAAADALTTPNLPDEDE